MTAAPAKPNIGNHTLSVHVAYRCCFSGFDENAGVELFAILAMSAVSILRAKHIAVFRLDIVSSANSTTLSGMRGYLRRNELSVSPLRVT